MNKVLLAVKPGVCWGWGWEGPSPRVPHRERKDAERRGTLAPQALGECLLSCRTHTWGWPAEGSVKTTILGKILRSLISKYPLSFQVSAMPSVPGERRKETCNYTITFWGIIGHKTGPRNVY